KLACEVDPLIDGHGLGRRRITLHARMGTHDVLKVGFAAGGSHDIIPIDRCPILAPGLNGALEAGWAIAEPLISIGKPLDLQITATETVSTSTCAARDRCQRPRSQRCRALPSNTVWRG